ncbi:restriction endonuclease subunit S [Cohnella xylanilytica]|uniref:restriction endonuclease subunit S n=1 Tax=Cohnella xylanilytica TaxID=557555 RepID=UPI001BB449BD|nr:restriction endonuclease subunit S [Cohnella xylanilytica]
MSEWKEVKISEISDIARGVSWSGSDETKEKRANDIRVYKIPHIQSTSRFQQETEPTYIPKLSKMSKYILQNDDILMVGSNGNPLRVGNVVRYRKSEEAVFASFLLRLRPLQGVDGNFLYYVLNGDRIQSSISEDSAGSTGLRNINAKEMSELPVLLPPLPEQRKIATILSSVDEAIEKTEAIIEQTEKVKKGLMQRLLTKGIGHSRFKQTEIGEIPEEWEVHVLSDVAERIFVGIATSTTGSYAETGVPILRNQNIKEDYLSTDDLLYITEEFSEANKSKKLKPGDVITVRTGYPGITCVVPETFEGAQTFTTLVTRPRKELLNPYFLSRFINSDMGKRFVLGGQAGGAQKNLNVGVLEKMVVPLPPMEEQNKIVEILKSIDDKLVTEKQIKHRYEGIKQALMQVLLTGKVRVKVNEQDEVVNT